MIFEGYQVSIGFISARTVAEYHSAVEEIDELLRLYDIARRPAHDATRRRIFSGFLGCRTYC
ncbi:hypothetical protein SISNIDRAFT_448093 [Sistotremastrum niveocremeum HHB9708]|uniref:Uncharacterized protein n=1 Tax=Sistotremastrum niveocremeum HHB9708 TaxID=1314777 RepID=A0A165ALR0_9AGAM|nr:hypothetical protein SISNIDRAFT_448093 [Sistotremastrum niveocremeum HHB9708]